MSEADEKALLCQHFELLTEMAVLNGQIKAFVTCKQKRMKRLRIQAGRVEAKIHALRENRNEQE